MENITDIKKYQEIIDNEFKKILKINIDNRELKIAITKNEVPIIKEFNIDDNSIFITFSDYYRSIKEEKDFEIVKNRNGEIVAVSVKNFNKFRNENYFNKFRKMLISEINDFPESNSIEILKKHKQIRVAHAISEILKSVPNNG